MSRNYSALLIIWLFFFMLILLLFAYFETLSLCVVQTGLELYLLARPSAGITGVCYHTQLDAVIV